MNSFEVLKQYAGELNKRNSAIVVSANRKQPPQHLGLDNEKAHQLATANLTCWIKHYISLTSPVYLLLLKRKLIYGKKKLAPTQLNLMKQMKQKHCVIFSVTEQ